jgi:hypothetical protein
MLRPSTNTGKKTTWPIPPAAPRTETLNPAPCCWFGTSAPAKAIHKSGLAVPTRLLPGTLLNGFRCPVCIWAKAATARRHRTRHKTTLVALPPRGPMVFGDPPRRTTRFSGSDFWTRPFDQQHFWPILSSLRRYMGWQTAAKIVPTPCNHDRLSRLRYCCD